MTEQGIEFEMVSMTDVAEAEKKLRGAETKLVWIESPTNPTMKLVDINAMAEAAHRANPEYARKLFDNNHNNVAHPPEAASVGNECSRANRLA